ncbi:hypothetical protein HNR42_003378 [Deinobacterium chartae]|uniref:Uncharacterized protein n=1 Tax=Deinobacterium chartae TaxID=521158 RepID=A0A841I628_9DEIO|nr:hypothetical protein [Deinobacterium chartae]MBB6099918.1 hypothetical protein [Deinobacterium chartae]
MQAAERVITDPAAARALEDSGFLGRFVRPASPSEVARSLGMRPNLAHHYARRYARLGLPFEAERRAGHVYYQLSAHTFKVDLQVIQASTGSTATHDLPLILEGYLRAYERSVRAAQPEEGHWSYHHFNSEPRPAPPYGALLPSPGRPTALPGPYA